MKFLALTLSASLMKIRWQKVCTMAHRNIMLAKRLKG